LWEGTRDLFLDRPVFAAGLSGFKELYAQKYFTCDAEPLEYPHNWVLNFWAETGILGLAAFILLLVSYFRTVAQYLSDPKKQWLALGFIAAMVYWLVHGLVDVPYFKNDLSLEFWVIVGLAGSLGRDG
jgi:O-antigen ligase